MVVVVERVERVESDKAEGKVRLGSSKVYLLFIIYCWGQRKRHISALIQ